GGWGRAKRGGSAASAAAAVKAAAATMKMVAYFGDADGLAFDSTRSSFFTSRTPVVLRATRSASNLSSAVATLPVKRTVPSLVSTLTSTRFLTRSAASFDFTAVVVFASSLFSPMDRSAAPHGAVMIGTARTLGPNA